MGKFRDGMPVTSEAVTPHPRDARPDQGDPGRARAQRRRAGRQRRRPHRQPRADGDRGPDRSSARCRARKRRAAGTLASTGPRACAAPGEVSSRNSSAPSARRPGPTAGTGSPPAAAAPSPRPLPSAGAVEARTREAGEAPVSKVQTIRVNVDTLEHLMTMVSELVLTRNQLLEIARRSTTTATRSAAAPLARDRGAAGRAS